MSLEIRMFFVAMAIVVVCAGCKGQPEESYGQRANELSQSSEARDLRAAMNQMAWYIPSLGVINERIEKYHAINGDWPQSVNDLLRLGEMRIRYRQNGDWKEQLLTNENLAISSVRHNDKQVTIEFTVNGVADSMTFDERDSHRLIPKG